MQIAAKLSNGLGREILHVKCSGEQITQRWLNLGLPEPTAKFMAYLETGSAGGMEERSNDAVEQVTGRPPLTFDAWVEQNKTAWQ
jgi:hypothetical protein